MPDKLEFRTRSSRSVVGQEAIEGSSIDQLYDEIWEVYREHAHQCSLFFIIKLGSNHANHIFMYNNDLQYSEQTYNFYIKFS